MPLALERKIYNNHKIISVPLQVSGHLKFELKTAGLHQQKTLPILSSTAL